MKLVQLTEIDKGNTATLKKVDGDVISANYFVIDIFGVYDQFGAIRRLDS